MSNQSKIFLIAGHHTNDPGAVSFHENLGNKVTEASLTIELRKLVLGYLKQHNDFEVILDDDKDTLNEVIAKINKQVSKNDIVVDLHFNAFNTKATGTEVLIPTVNSNIEKELGLGICARLADIMEIPNRGIKTEAQSGRKRIAILHGVGHRVLPEICFKDNSRDMSAYQINKHLVAQAIALEIESAVNKIK